MKKSAKITKFTSQRELRNELDKYAPRNSKLRFLLIVAPIFQLITSIILLTAVTLLLGAAYLVGHSYARQTVTFIEGITGQHNETQQYSVLVLKSSKYEKIEQLKNQHIGFLNTNPNLGATEDALKSVINFTAKEQSELGSLVAGITSFNTSAVVLADSYIDYMEENKIGFYEESKVIYTFEIRVEQSEPAAVADVSQEPFIVYLSGSDSRGSLQQTARSDVNILAVVNPKESKVLLVSIPRDYYVQLHGTTGTRDKLTHAGIYGIDMSRKTIEDLLNIEINYTVKVGFTSFIQIVDAIGGIEVDSDQEFTAHTNKSCHIAKGKQHLDSECALAYSRERYAYASGDRHRGQNQQEVITAIINKMGDPRQLVKYSEILKATEGSLETSMSYDEITKLINSQLTTMNKWTVESISLDGSGAMLPTYSMGSQNLYVMMPDQATIYNAQKKIAEYLDK